MTILRFVAMLALLATPIASAGQDVVVRPDGAMDMPAITIPSSTLMSEEGNRSRVEHIVTERGLKGKTSAEVNTALFGPWLERTKSTFPVSIRADRIAGVPVIIYQPPHGTALDRRGRVLINVHGGGFVGCFVECGGLESIPVAALSGITVVSIDYRLAPAARFPAASEDVAAVYRALLRTRSAKQIGLYGCSAGGLLTAQSLAWFHAHGLPMPAAAGIFCAGADPQMQGDSRTIGFLIGDGEVPRPATPGAPLLGYMTGAATTDPTAYPASDQTTLKSFPPTLILSGTRDFALSSAVNLHSRLVANGVDARLHLWEGGRHAFFYDVRIPEAHEAFAVVADFFVKRLR